MIQLKRLLAAGTLAGVFGLTLLATSSFANGPLTLGSVRAPVVAPSISVAPIVRINTVKLHMLNSYRELRSFWLSRAIVR